LIDLKPICCYIHYTDVEDAVDAVKDYIQALVPDQDAWETMEAIIDGYVTKRQSEI